MQAQVYTIPYRRLPFRFFCLFFSFVYQTGERNAWRAPAQCSLRIQDVPRSVQTEGETALRSGQYWYHCAIVPASSTDAKSNVKSEHLVPADWDLWVGTVGTQSVPAGDSGGRGSSCSKQRSKE